MHNQTALRPLRGLALAAIAYVAMVCGTAVDAQVRIKDTPIIGNKMSLGQILVQSSLA